MSKGPWLTSLENEPCNFLKIKKFDLLAAVANDLGELDGCIIPLVCRAWHVAMKQFLQSMSPLVLHPGYNAVRHMDAPLHRRKLCGTVTFSAPPLSFSNSKKDLDIRYFKLRSAVLSGQPLPIIERTLACSTDLRSLNIAGCNGYDDDDGSVAIARVLSGKTRLRL